VIQADTREGNRLRVFENRVPRRIFGPTRDEVAGNWRKLHNEELHDCKPHPYCNQIKEDMMGGHVVRMWEMINV
jgi:hypothetical protein